MRAAFLCALALVAAGRRNPAEAGARVAHFGGSGPTRAQAIAADSQGNSYIAGSTRASDFPGGGCLAASGAERLFVAKFSPAGDMLSAVCVRGGDWANATGLALDRDGDIYLTANTQSGDSFNGLVLKLGADLKQILYTLSLGRASPSGMAVDAAGNAYVTGTGRPADVPTTPCAFQTASPGECARTDRHSRNTLFPPRSEQHPFVLKLSPEGRVVYGTLVTGSCGGFGQAAAVDGAGRAWVAGSTYSTDLPVSAAALQASFPDARASGFIAALSLDGSALVYSTFLGGGNYASANALALDGAGNVYAAGDAATLPPFSATTLGGPWTTGCAPVMGIGPTPPTNNDADAWVVKFNPSSPSPMMAVRIAAACADSPRSLALDSAGNVWVAGMTQSANFPTLAPIGGLGSGSGFLSALVPGGSRLVFSTFVGEAGGIVPGPQGGIRMAAIDNQRAALIDADVSAPQIALDAVLHQSRRDLAPPWATLEGIAPGELVRLTGRGMGPNTAVGGTFTASGLLATSLAGVQVRFDGIPAPLLLVSSTEILCMTPFALSGREATQIEVEYQGQKSNGVTVHVVAQSPAPLGIFNEDWSPNTPANPARAGSWVFVYATGFGQTDPPAVDGALYTGAQRFGFPVKLWISGQPPYEADYVGAAPGMLAGIVQINVRIPEVSGATGLAGITLGTNGFQIYLKE